MRCVNSSGGNAFMVNGTINWFANIMTGQSVTSFSDWMLAEAIPTSANVSVGGRVLTTGGYGISNAGVTLSHQNGDARRALTNSFG